MKPHEIRLRVFEEHEKLREMLDELDGLNKRFESGDEQVGAEIREFGSELFEVFASHLTLEDALLVPAIKDAMPEGPTLADRLSREHAEQRSILHYLFRRLEEEDRPTALISNELRSFAEYLRRDMHHEEETILSQELFPDPS
jgi:hemerythrin-like domain-containing protein